MSSISRRAEHELDKLLAGEELKVGDSQITLPDDVLAPHVLAELIARQESGDLGVSRDKAEAFVERVEEASAAADEESTPPPSRQPRVALPRQGLRWRLHRLVAHNYRGLTEWEGQRFEYDFMGLPHHIYGPNGSGKTAILSAAVWCLTGYCLRERAEPADAMREVDLYEDESAARRIDAAWPEAVTVPHNLTPGALAKEDPHCWVEVELHSGERCVYVRRSLDGQAGESDLEVREGDAQYSSLADVGIADTDCEVTMLMPARVSALQFEPGSKFSENLMAVSGLEALRDIGDLARRLRTQVSTVSNNWEKEALRLLQQAANTVREATSQETIGDDVRKLLQDTEASCDRGEQQSDAAYRAMLYSAQSEAVRQRADEEFREVETAVGAAEGTERPEDRPAHRRAAIVEALGRARHVLEEKPPDDWTPFADWLALEANIDEALQGVSSWAERVGAELGDRHEVWAQNRKVKGRLDVKICAAHYLERIGRFQDCPVCEQDLPERIRAELTQLASKARAGADSLRVYVQEQKGELGKELPEDLRNLAGEEPAAQVKRTLDAQVVAHTRDLGRLHKRIEKQSAGSVEALPDYEWTEPTPPFVRPDWDEEFSKIVDPLAREYKSAQRLCAVGSWAEEHAKSALRETERLVDALTEELRRLEKYGARYSALIGLAQTICEAASLCQKAENLSERIACAKRVQAVLTAVSRLEDYANACLEADIVGLAEAMQRFYGTLYPNDPVGLASLVNRATKKGAKPDYRCILKWSDELFADADPIANAGRIRGLLWSYTFALVEKQAPALELILLDDPYTSLDDYAAGHMVTDLLVGELGPRYQVLSTVQAKHHLDPIFARDPSQQRFGIAHVLHRGPEERRCRVVQGLEPLCEAIRAYDRDPEQYRQVIQETRIYLERNLKLVADYVLTGDHDAADFGQLMDALIAASMGGTGASSVGSRMQVALRELLKRLGVDFGTSPPAVTTSSVILHALHHGGPREDLATAVHARYVARKYTVWAKDFEALFQRIDATLARATRSAILRAEQMPTVDEHAIPLKRHRVPACLLQIGRAAAEGTVTLEGVEAVAATQHTWPELEFALVVTDVCGPVALAGQVGVFAPSSPVKDGDLALMACADGCFLRRVFSTPLGEGTQAGWVGHCVNPLLRHVPPIVRREDDVRLRKLVGVVFTLGQEAELAQASADGDLVALPSPWPRALQEINAGKVCLVELTGDSAEPVALGGQFLIVTGPSDVSQVPDNSLCCVQLSDDSAVLKRLTRSVTDPRRVLLQPINTSAGYPTLEAALPPIAQSPDARSDELPHLVDIRVVSGVLFSAPEELDS